MSKHLIIGNWKMNPGTLREAQKIVRATRKAASTLTHTDVVVCPPALYIQACISKKSSIVEVGSQYVSIYESGAHTGEYSAHMISNIGATYAIIGHSEQRQAGDTDSIVASRIKAALEAGLHVVVCIGEKVRDEEGAYLDVLKHQIKETFAGVPAKYVHNIILAYEPIWAIGATEAMKPEQVYETSLFVKKVFSDVFSQESAMKVRVLYGGSVNFRNAGDIIRVGKIDGLLVGRESINIPGFKELLKAVDQVK
ncbi:MAG: triose-phosphate isomerase [Candidatus Taylorbacteria bacterium]